MVLSTACNEKIDHLHVNVFIHAIKVIELIVKD